MGHTFIKLCCDRLQRPILGAPANSHLLPPFPMRKGCEASEADRLRSGIQLKEKNPLVAKTNDDGDRRLVVKKRKEQYNSDDNKYNPVSTILSHSPGRDIASISIGIAHSFGSATRHMGPDGPRQAPGWYKM